MKTLTRTEKIKDQGKIKNKEEYSPNIENNDKLHRSGEKNLYNINKIIERIDKKEKNLFVNNRYSYENELLKIDKSNNVPNRTLEIESKETTEIKNIKKN